jgi:hypothetical protein
MVIDVQNVLVCQVDTKQPQSLAALRMRPDFQQNYIVIDDNQVYQVRPYTLSFIRAIQPFFEIIVFSKMNRHVLI